jgi:hypothetical protein
MANLPKQIIGSFEDIGKQIISETAKVPVDIAGQALEGLGVTVSPKGQQTPAAAPKSLSEMLGLTPSGINVNGQGAEKNPVQKYEETQDPSAKKAIAREALEWLTKGKTSQGEPSEWEKKQKEEADKKEQQKLASEQERASQLQPMSQKKKRGDLYGMKAKKSSTEIGRNVRQD